MVDSSRFINSAHHGAPSAPAGGARGVGMRSLGIVTKNSSPDAKTPPEEVLFDSGTGEIVAYVWGKRDLATVQRLKTKLKQLGIHYTRIASDHWDSFITAFKNCKQSIGKLFTVGIEGNNCKIRHRIRRGFRRSCNFSKKLENHFKAFDLTFFYINNGFI